MNEDVPIYKVGAIILRAMKRGQEVLIIRPKPKNKGEMPQLVLPRGSRQYKDGELWHDVRDAATAMAKVAALEPLDRALRREIEEEAGIPQAMLRSLDVRPLGARNYHSRTKGIYPVYWFVVIASESAQREIARAAPPDTLEVRWVDMDTLQRLVEEGAFAKGYLPVVQEVMEIA